MQLNGKIENDLKVKYEVIGKYLTKHDYREDNPVSSVDFVRITKQYFNIDDFDYASLVDYLYDHTEVRIQKFNKDSNIYYYNVVYDSSKKGMDEYHAYKTIRIQLERRQFWTKLEQQKEEIIKVMQAADDIAKIKQLEFLNKVSDFKNRIKDNLSTYDQTSVSHS